MDAWDQLRALLGKKGDQAAAAMVARLQANRNYREWTCSLHLAGTRDRPLTYWVEPVVPQPLTESREMEHTTGK